MAIESLSLPSPAKLNLFLHINGRYENGYHELQSVFQLLDYGDHIHLELNQSGTIQLATELSGVAHDDNMIVKAARLLQQHSKTDLGANIRLDKKLPMGGGIGGGSSNAATVLLGLNQLWNTQLDLDALAQLGKTLGADVPVFVRGNSAFAEGIGECLSPIELPSAYYLVATPHVHVSTQSIFNHPDLPRHTAKINKTEYNFASTVNDCETLVCKLHPDVANLLQWLLQFAPSRMTGTGASVFAVFSDKHSAEHVLSQLPVNYRGFVARGVNRSGLHAALAI